MSPEFYWIAVVATTVIAAARLTRLANIDKFPPVKRVRDWYEAKTEATGWVWLTLCGYCMAPWMTLVVLGTGLIAEVYQYPHHATWGDAPWPFIVWWLIAGWLALSYLAAIVMANDGSDVEEG